jgi:hypothetical protein
MTSNIINNNIINNNINNKLGISTTVKNPHQLNDWIKYHLSIGFDKLYIVFDDENELVAPD